MSDFLKKIVPPAKGGLPGRKLIIQDIIPKRKAGEPRAKKSGRRETVAEKVEPLEKSRKEKYEGQPIVELPVKRWEPRARSILAFRGLKAGKRFWAITVLAALVIFIIILSTALASLTITLRPVSAKITVPAITVVADTKILATNEDAKKIPGLKIAIEKTYQESFSSSGKKYIEDFAHGRLGIFNAFSSAPQVLIAGTRFTDAGGRVFKLLKTITIPGANIEEGKIIPSSIEADVIADKPGEEYNIAPADFNIPGFKGTPKYAAFYGRSRDAFSGGFKGEARIVTTTDIKNAQEKVSQTLFNQLKAALKEKLPTGDEFISLDGSRSVFIQEIKNPKADERADEFSASASGVAEMIIFKKSDLLTLLGSALLSPDRPSTILASSFKPTYKNIRLDVQSGQLSFGVEGEALAVRNVPSDEIRSVAVSKTNSKLEDYLRNRPEIAGFVIKNFPVWRWWTPKRLDSIFVKIELPE